MGVSVPRQRARVVLGVDCEGRWDALPTMHRVAHLGGARAWHLVLSEARVRAKAIPQESGREHALA
eukprot:12701214-Alexandrium_andersonii.AAC.1